MIVTKKAIPRRTMLRGLGAGPERWESAFGTFSGGGTIAPPQGIRNRSSAVRPPTPDHRVYR